MKDHIKLLWNTWIPWQAWPYWFLISFVSVSTPISAIVWGIIDWVFDISRHLATLWILSSISHTELAKFVGIVYAIGRLVTCFMAQGSKYRTHKCMIPSLCTKISRLKHTKFKGWSHLCAGPIRTVDPLSTCCNSSTACCPRWALGWASLCKSTLVVLIFIVLFETEL